MNRSHLPDPFRLFFWTPLLILFFFLVQPGSEAGPAVSPGEPVILRFIIPPTVSFPLSCSAAQGSVSGATGPGRPVPIGPGVEDCRSIPLCAGSGLAFVREDPPGTYQFLALTDRGPNADAPDVRLQDETRAVPAKFFPLPDYGPEIVELQVASGQARYGKRRRLRAGDGSPLTGLPLPAAPGASAQERAFDPSFRLLPGDPHGADPEGIAIDRQRECWWIVEEYGPKIFQVDPESGRVQRDWTIASGLPDILRFRLPNRGFEGVTVTPNGTVMAVLQSVLETTGDKDKASGNFIRLVGLNPETGDTSMFAYPIDPWRYRSPADAKIGDILALSDTLFLLIEEGLQPDGTMLHWLTLLDVAGATKLPDSLRAGQILPECMTPLQRRARRMRMPRKLVLADLRACGWTAKKAEGLAILPDGKTIAICSDNDFALNIEVVKPSLGKDGRPVTDPRKYQFAPGKGYLYGGIPVPARMRLWVSDDPAELWFLRFPRPVGEFVLW